MGKELLLLACVAGCVLIARCDGVDDAGKTPPTAETKLTEKKPAGETKPTGYTVPTHIDDNQTPSYGCGGHPPICGKNEIYNNCSVAACVARRCSELGFPLKCDMKCKPGCVCQDNYVRNDDGTCIPILNCPSCGGDKNAQRGCSNYCGHSCTDYNKPGFCPLFCMSNGCDCRPGFVYDRNVKACVKPKDCTPICKANEQYSSCVNGGCDARNCSQVGKAVPCVKLPPESCIKGCICVAGYLRADNGTCVPKDQCPKHQARCSKNEVYNNCSDNVCVARQCSELGFPLKCDMKCKPGCVCQENYVRNDDGTCIPILNCPSCGGDKHAQNGCSNYCGHSCSDYNKPPRPCPRFCMANGCACRPGFVYDNNMKACVKPKDCTPICKANEQYSSCVNGGCDARNCSQVGKPVPCVKLAPESCIKGCICVAGYLRADNGTCVPKDQCQKDQARCSKNEVYNNCSDNACVARRCSELGFPLKCDMKCKPGCVCQENYVRNDDGTCIPILNCPSCGGDKNAQRGCSNYCGHSCSDYNKPPGGCPLFCMENGCACRPGFVYDNNVKACVKPKDCTPICKANEQYSSCVNGGCDARNCSQVGKPVPCVKLAPESCIKGCICVAGYLRADNGTCVPKDQCPQHQARCSKNEVYNNCSDNACVARRCSELGFPLKCDMKCKPGCVCQDNYVRNDDGTCIPILNCPSCGGDKNAQHGCSNYCGNSCPDYNTPRSCPNFCMANGCACRPGFVYDYNLKACVKPKDCTPICKANEQYSSCVNGGCDARNCSQVGKPVPCVDLTPESCIKGCICVAGYLRADNGTCVPKVQCPKQCGANERYVICPDTMCIPQNCSQRELSVPCPILGPKGLCPGKPKCICVENYLRDDDSGICIPSKKCTKSCGKNEYWENCVSGCSNQTCEEIGVVRSCPLQIAGQCMGGCRCKPGYWRNSDNVCIPEKECPRCYGKNEYWEKCITGCTNQTCADIGQRINCPNIQEGQCKSGCRCHPGFWRNASNVCIPENECPTPDCPDGEFWNRCPTVKCEGDYCPKTKDSPQTCPTGIVCDKPRCVCSVNRKRDQKTGKCIPITQCPEFKCGRNEQYQAGPVFCPGENCTDYINKSKCPPGEIGIINICRPKCKCMKGYYRNATGACIPACECPIQPTSITTTAPPPTPSTPPSGGSSSSRGTGLTGILDGIAAFTGKCLYNRMKSGALENIIMSAFSVFTPIAELCLYSEGAAYDQCIKVLNLKDKQDIRNTFPALTSSYEGQTSVNFTTAAKVYSNENNPLSDGFKKDAVDVFHAEAQDLDFSKNTEAANTINNWVESKTNKRIKNLISPDVISALTRLVLINAIYFKGEWLYQFNPENTNEDNFYLNDGTTKKVKFMHQMRTFKYGEVSDLNCKVVDMYYKGQNCSMVIVLPNSNNGIMDLAKNLQDPVNWNKVHGSLSSERVELSIPPFEMSTNTDLKNLLNAVNITNWFDPNNSGLKGITKKQEDVFVSAAIQKSFIKLDETGSEAAAANAVIVGATSVFEPNPPKEFNCNHSFLYYILFKQTAIFSGVVVNP